MSMFLFVRLNNVGISTSFPSKKFELIDRNEQNDVLGKASLNNNMANVLSAKLVKDSKTKACVTSNPTKNLGWRKLWLRILCHSSNAVLKRMPGSHVDGLIQIRMWVRVNVMFKWILNKLYHAA